MQRSLTTRGTGRRRVLARLVIAGAGPLLAAAGCRPAAPAFSSIDITGADYARGFDATDTAGRRRSLADYRGKVVMVFFGFAQCPDICPTALLRQAEAMQLLGADAARVQSLFITVDPERDTEAMVDAYAKGFDARFAGLRFDPDTTYRIAREFKAMYQKVRLGDSALDYTIDHTALSYVFDPQGRIRLAVRHDQSATEIARDLKHLLDGR